MNTLPDKCRQGFSSTDLLAIVIAVAIVAVIGYTQFIRHHQGRKVRRIMCVSNQKNIGLSFRMWSGDYGRTFPARVSVTNGGVMELASQGAASPSFLAMSNELSTPKILICPEERDRQYVTTFSALADTNLSYFVNLDADETQPQGWLIGDRNLATNNTPLKPGLTTISRFSAVTWTDQFHVNEGNLGFADGSVYQLSNPKLGGALRGALPAISTSGQTNWTFRLAIP